MSNFKNILAGLVNRKGIAESVEAALVCEEFGKILNRKNKKFSKHLQVISLKDKILRVQTDSSGWMQELQLVSHEIVEELNKKFGHEAVKKIMFRS